MGQQYDRQQSPAQGFPPRARDALKGADFSDTRRSQPRASLLDRESCIPVCVEAQNAAMLSILAAIIIERRADQVIFEVFEVCPRNESVMSTKGRLRRHFPASCIAVPVDTIRETDFRDAISESDAPKGDDLSDTTHNRAQLRVSPPRVGDAPNVPTSLATLLRPTASQGYCMSFG